MWKKFGWQQGKALFNMLRWVWQIAWSTISMADRILVLEKGRLIETGCHADLLARDGHYAMLYCLHQQQYGSFTNKVGPFEPPQ